MQRRHMITALGATAFIGLGSPMVHAEGVDLSEAINKAGRQRMLSQRMSKAWLTLALGIEKSSAQQVLDKSIALFDRQLVELTTLAPSAGIKLTYKQLGSAWGDYKTALLGTRPDKSGAAMVLQLDAKVLALAHQGTQQYEAAFDKPLGKLVNIAGRQRMLSQRMAKFYLASRLPVNSAAATSEIGKARLEFVSAMDILRSAPQDTPRIKDELQLADGQWLFFDHALQTAQGTQNGNQDMMDVFVTSENLLSVMDLVTGLYSAVKV